MNKRIIGIGSPFGADQLGWQAIDLLSNTSLIECELIKLDRPGSELIRYFDMDKALVLIDAVQADGIPGTPMPLKMSDLSGIHCQTSSHGIGVAEALQMAELLGLIPHTMLLIGIATGSDLTRVPEIDQEQLMALVQCNNP